MRALAGDEYGRAMVENQVRLAMVCVVTLALLVSGLFVLLGGLGGTDLQRLAGGWIGLLTGYWLK
jgi:hypothetical protein